MPQDATLRRNLSLPLITFYGLGTILGAGIYVLIGEVAGRAGAWTPLAFLLASLLAAFSAFSYAELSARFPLSAGEAVYVYRAFGRPRLSLLIGLMIIAIGMVSTATLVNGFVGYLGVFVDASPAVVITLLVLGLGATAAWGIRQSAWLALVTTLVELGGLLLIILVGLPHLGTVPDGGVESARGMELWLGVLGGAFIAFYAFIGFEDIVNVAEEVREPSRNLPRAVLLSLAVATALYMLVAVVALATARPAELAASEAPLALVYERSTGQAPVFIGLIGMAAVINGALIQIIMATRILYGMGRQGWLPEGFARVHPVTRTPLRATVLITAVVLVLALWLPLVTLAETTSFITLMVFAVVNLSLWRVKRREPLPEGVRGFPAWLPLAGFAACLLFVLFQLLSVFGA